MIFLLFFYSLYFLMINSMGGQCLSTVNFNLSKDIISKITAEDYKDGAGIKFSESDLESLDHFSVRILSTTKGLFYFTSKYCLSKYLTGDPLCSKLEQDQCETSLSNECVTISLRKYAQMFPNLVCQSGILNSLTLGNSVGSSLVKSYNYIDVPTVLNIGVFVSLIALVVFLSYELEEESLKMNESIISVRQYSVKLINMPKYCTRHHHGDSLNTVIKDYIENLGDYKVRQVNIAYDIQPFLQKIAELEKISARIQKDVYKIERKQQIEEDSIEFELLSITSDTLLENKSYCTVEIESQIKDLKSEILKMQKDFINGTSEHMLGAAYISFETIRQKQKFMNKYRLDTYMFNQFGIIKEEDFGFDFEFNHKQQKTHVTIAVEPGDVIWKNQGISRREVTKRIVISKILCTVVIFTVFGLLSLLRILQVDFVGLETGSDAYSNWKNAITLYIFSSSITLSDYLFSKYIKKLAKYQRNKTISEEQIAQTAFNWKSQYMSNAMTPVVICCFELNFFGVAGLTQMVTTLYLSMLSLNMVIQAGGSVGSMRKKFKKSVLDFVENETGTIFNQRDAIKAFQRDTFNLSVGYGNMFKTLSISLFFMPIIPLAVPFGTLILIFQYNNDKVIYLCLLEDQYMTF